MTASYSSNWINETPSKDKLEEMAIRSEEEKIKFVESLVINAFHIEVHLKKLEDKLSTAKDIEQIIPKMLLNQYLSAIRAINNKNQDILINITINN